MNPFSAMVDKENIFNISIGKAASEETSDFLLNGGHIGSSARDAFVQDGCDDPRYSKLIKLQKIKTFSTESGKYKISSSSENKLVSVSMTRDLFGSILFHALQAKVDMAHVLKYPLTPVPLTISHADGMMQKKKQRSSF